MQKVIGIFTGNFGSTSPRDTFAWKHGKTTGKAGQLMAFNGITAEALCKRAVELIK